MAFLRNVYQLPATILSGMSNLLFGSYQKDRDGKILVDQNNQPKTNPGLLGYIFAGLAYGFRAVSNFISNHKTAIANAFWASLVLAGAAALTVALWPAALTAVTTFSIAGLSIAALVGTGFVAQVGAVAALAATATSAAVYAAATVVNGVSSLVSLVANRGSVANGPQTRAQTGLTSVASQLEQEDDLFSDDRASTQGRRSDVQPAPQNGGRMFNTAAAPFVPRAATPGSDEEASPTILRK